MPRTKWAHGRKIKCVTGLYYSGDLTENPFTRSLKEFVQIFPRCAIIFALSLFCSLYSLLCGDILVNLSGETVEIKNLSGNTPKILRNSKLYPIDAPTFTSLLRAMESAEICRFKTFWV